MVECDVVNVILVRRFEDLCHFGLETTQHVHQQPGFDDNRPSAHRPSIGHRPSANTHVIWTKFYSKHAFSGIGNSDSRTGLTEFPPLASLVCGGNSRLCRYVYHLLTL